MFRNNDAAALRALISARLASTLYEARAIEVLHAALVARDDAVLVSAESDDDADSDDEHLGLLLPSATRAAAAAVIGVVAGAVGTWRVHWAFGEDHETLAKLLRHAVEVAYAQGARLIVCELPDDAPFALTQHALAHTGFKNEATVPDFVCPGTALQLWVARR